MKQSDFDKAPVASKKPVTLEKFGTKRIDDYFWLNQKDNPEVIEYIKSENAYTDIVMESTKGIQEKIFEEIRGRIKEDDESYPYLDNGYYYYTRTLKGKEYPEYLRKKGSIDAEEEVVFDLNKMAEGSKAFVFFKYFISPNNKLAAYTYNTTGSYAEFELKIRDLLTGKDLDFSVSGAYSFAFANDSKTLFYSVIDESLRPSKIYRQGIDSDEAVLVYEETDEKFRVDLYADKLSKFIYIVSDSSTTSEERFVSADSPEDDFKVFMPRIHRTRYSLDLHRDSFFVKYQDDDNLNSKIYKVSFDTYEDKSTWKEIVKHNKDVNIESLEVFEDYLATITRKNGLKNINIISLKLGEDYKTESIQFPEEAYNIDFEENEEFGTSKLRYSYNSLKRPTTIYEYDMKTKEKKTLKVQEIPSGFDSDDYELERVMVNAKDGQKVPMALIYKKGLKKGVPNPTLLYAYGSYGYSTEIDFDSRVFSLVDRGYIYAIAQIRGGSEMGEFWYQNGKMLNKKNTLTDFIACSEYLIDKGYTSNKKLSIMGLSAGGILMGGVANMRPDLYQSIIALVPFVDVVTTMLDESLPLTTGEYEEWGNPNHEEEFKYMLSYSPYDNIESKDYPNILVTGGLNDSQVLYHEPTKYVAKLRSLKTDDNVLLLHMNMDSGHGGGTGRYESIKDTAFYYSFLFKTID